jgi:hypothetical protein
VPLDDDVQEVHAGLDLRNDEARRDAFTEQRTEFTVEGHNVLIWLHSGLPETFLEVVLGNHLVVVEVLLDPDQCIAGMGLRVRMCLRAKEGHQLISNCIEE